MDTRCPANTLGRFLQVVSTVAYIVSSHEAWSYVVDVNQH
jgi:hypothetical protein